MRRNAINLFVSGVCGLLSIGVIGSAGRADEGSRVATESQSISNTQEAAKTQATARADSAISASAPLLFASETTQTIAPKAEPHPTELLHEVTSAAKADEVVAPKQAALPKYQTVLMEVTAYCPCAKCCGARAHGITASGFAVSHDGGLFVAADPRVPFHTKLIIPGYANNQPVEVLDRGGAIKGAHLDVFFPTHQQAMEWGRRKIEVLIAQ